MPYLRPVPEALSPLLQRFQLRGTFPTVHSCHELALAMGEVGGGTHEEPGGTSLGVIYWCLVIIIDGWW